MKLFLKKLSSLTLAALFALLVGCSPSDTGAKSPTDAANEATAAATTTDATTTGTAISYQRHTYKMNDIKDRINVLGRSPITEEGLRADWSASGFEFVADCKNMIKITINSSHDCRFNFYADGGELKAVNVSAGKRSYTVANDLEGGVHSFRFVKSSMVEHGTKALAVTIESVELYGEIGQAEQREHLIEFIGDSITCGVGAKSNTDSGAYSELSYAYLTANRLDTDYSLVSVSGIGTGQSTERHGSTLIGDVYPLTNFYRSKTERYEPERKADLVVINLNTNDKGCFTAAQKDEFTAKVKGLVDTVKATHGDDVKIVWLMGMMFEAASGHCDVWTIQYLNELGGEAAGYYYLTLNPNTAGGASHPIASAHESAADALTEFIKSKGLL